MSFDLTRNAKVAARQTNLKPQIVVEIDGISTLFGAVAIYKYIRIGDPGLYIGNDWVIGGYSLIADQADYVSFDKGTTSKIDQKLDPSRGLGTAVTRMAVGMIDKRETLTEIISPGFVVDDLLGREVTVHLGFQDTAYPEDFIDIFQGTITDISSGPGNVVLGMASPDEKKRTPAFGEQTCELDANISNGGSVSTITVDSTANFPVPVNGPSGSPDAAIEFYVRIDDEIFRYTGKTATTFTGCTRAQLGTVNESHDIGASVTSVVRLKDNGIRLAQKLMQSGTNGYFATGVAAKNFNQVDPMTYVANSLFFQFIDVESDWGLTIGDYVTTTGAANGANNVTLKQITDIETTNDGSYVVLSGVSFVDESGSSATASFRSQWDTLGQGAAMKPYQVDNSGHDDLYSIFLSSFEYDFRISGIDNIKDFLDLEIYKPMGCYGIPKRGRSSAAYHTAPVPGTKVLTLDQTNILNADALTLKRSTSTNFANVVKYSYDYDIVKNKFAKIVEFDGDYSYLVDRVGEKVLDIKSQGIRTTSAALSITLIASDRLLDRYSRGAEYLTGVKIHYGDGYDLDIADIVILDTASLSVSDTSAGNRDGKKKFYEITNKTLDIKSGGVTVDLVDTSFGVDDRYCLISPSSLVKSGTTTQILLSELDEGLKWEDLVGAKIIVRDTAFTYSYDSFITAVSGNKVTVSPALSSAPSSGDIMELDIYDEQPDTVKLLFGFMNDSATFPDGTPQYLML